jgi:glutamate racemase
MTPRNLTIGVFDSGFGGLTVLRALLELVPSAHYIYLGDTARLPYGSKSRETISRYAVESARFLHQRGAEMLVIACNTATALALDDIRASLPIPVIGVIQPGALAALAATSVSPDAGSTVVLATPATVQSHAYLEALNALGLPATEKACPLLVPLAEEGWIDHPVTAEVLRIYLTEALAADPTAHTLLLGCTHYPVLQPLIASVLTTLHHPMVIIDSAQATAQAVEQAINHTSTAPSPNSATPTPAEPEFYATDSVEKFQRLGSLFLGRPVHNVHLIDLGG